MAAVIGALQVVLGANSAGLTSDLDKARGAVASFGSDIAKAGAVIGAALAAAYASIGLSVSNTIQQMDAFGKQSQKIGIPVEALSALKLAADVSGISMEQLTTGVGKLSKAMVEAAAKPTSEAALAFRALGVSVTDSTGKLLPTIDVTTAIAAKFAGLNDGAGKTAVSMALFGKAGAELIPMLNMGSDGLTKMMQNAQAFGIVIDGQTSAAAKKFTNTLTMLSAAKDGIIVRLTAYMLPALQTFAQRMLDAASSSDKQASKLSILQTGFDALARVVMFAADNFKIFLQLGAVFVAASVVTAAVSLVTAFVGIARAIQAAGLMMAAFEAIRALSLRGILLLAGAIAVLSGNFESMTSTLGDIGKKIESVLPASTGDTFRTIVKSLGFDLSALTKDITNFGTATPAVSKALGDFNYQAMAGKTALDGFLNSQQKSIAGQQAEADQTNMSAGAKARLKVILEGLAVAQRDGTVATEAQRAKLTETANAADLVAQKLSNIALIGQLNPFLPIQAAIDATNLKLQEGGLKATDYALLSGQSAQLTAKLWEMAGTSLGSSFDKIGTSMSQMSSGMANMAQIGKAIGAAIAFVNSYVAATSALATAVFPANIAIAAGVLANGLAMVAAIKSAVVPHAAMGGAFRVPGGMGGGDRMPVGMMLEPGELVEVSSNRPDGYKSGGDRGGPQSGGVTMVYIDAALRPLVDALFPHINAAIRDGHQLKLATT